MTLRNGIKQDTGDSYNNKGKISIFFDSKSQRVSVSQPFTISEIDLGAPDLSPGWKNGRNRRDLKTLKISGLVRTIRLICFSTELGNLTWKGLDPKFTRVYHREVRNLTGPSRVVSVLITQPTMARSHRNKKVGQTTCLLWYKIHTTYIFL